MRACQNITYAMQSVGEAIKEIQLGQYPNPDDIVVITVLDNIRTGLKEIRSMHLAVMLNKHMKSTGA